jgi:phage baseplate assembly protein W
LNSLSFPNMFNSSSSLVVKDGDASKQDLKLLLGSEKGELLGDPFYGIRIKKYAFNQNNYVLRDVLVDEIYSQLATFAPQFTVSRDDITITSKNNKLYATIKAINKLDFTTNMYNIELLNDEER